MVKVDVAKTKNHVDMETAKSVVSSNTRNGNGNWNSTAFS